MLGLPIIENLYDFSKATRLSQKAIYQYSKYNLLYYKTYALPKKSGGERLISQPSRSLKALQSWILNNILSHLIVSTASKGFEKNTSILDNAKPHQGANSILCVDIEDFFPSVKSNMVYTIFNSIGYNKYISSILTNICSFKGGLPQGSPCSPKLSNLVCLRLDKRIQGYVGRRNIVYTRYADDLTFSALSIQKLCKSYKMIEKIINDEGFQLNKSKTRFIGPSRCKKITGLVVTEDQTGVGRKQYRLLRSKIYNLTKDSDIKNTELNHINGWLSYVCGVDKVRYGFLVEYINTLKSTKQCEALDKLKIV